MVDGPSDREFWRGHLRKHFRNAHHQVDKLGTRGLERAFDQTVEAATGAGCGCIVFLTDEDADPDPAERVKKLEVKLARLRKREPQVADKVRVFGIRRCLEAWFLADEGAVNKALPKTKYKCPRKTDGLRRPKGTAKRLFAKQRGVRNTPTEKGIAAEMVCKVDFGRASKWSDSLKVFWDEMKDVFEQWR